MIRRDEPEFFLNAEIPLTDLGKGVSRKVLAHSEDLMVVEVSFQPGSEGSVHSHPHTQISYVKSGVFEYSVRDVSRIIREGDSVVIESNIPHGCRCIEGGTLVDVFTPMRRDFIS